MLPLLLLGSWPRLDRLSRASLVKGLPLAVRLWHTQETRRTRHLRVPVRVCLPEWYLR